MIIVEGGQTPRCIPKFRIIEFCKEEEFSTDVSNQTSMEVLCNQEELLNNLKMFEQEKNELTSNMRKLRDQLSDVECHYQKELEEMEAKMFLEKEKNYLMLKEMENQEKQIALLESSKQEMLMSSNEDLEQNSNKTTIGNSNIIPNENCVCQTALVEAHAETGRLKVIVEQSVSKCNVLEAKLGAAQIELDTLKTDQIRWTRKVRSLEAKGSQTQAELCEMTQLYDGLCALKLTEEDGEALTDLRIRFQKAKNENNEIKLQYSTMKEQLEKIKQENGLLQKCLYETKRNECELDLIVKQLKKRGQAVNQEHKEIQTVEEAEFQRTLMSLVNTMDVEEETKQMLMSPLNNQPVSTETFIQHIKLVYSEYSTSNRNSKEQEIKFKMLENQYLDLNKNKEKLEKRIQKLSEICKAFQALGEVQEKEIRQYKEMKTTLTEKNEKCEMLSKRLADLEVLIAKTKERKNVFKKKYFKERLANRKKNKKKNENWLSKIFDWGQTVQY